MFILLILNYIFRLSKSRYFWFSNYASPWMFLSLDILFKYWIERVTFALLCVMFTFSTRVSYKRVLGFAADCPCGVWCCGLTTCLLFVGPRFGNLVWNDSGFVSLTQWRLYLFTFCCISVWYKSYYFKQNYFCIKWYNIDFNSFKYDLCQNSVNLYMISLREHISTTVCGILSILDYTHVIAEIWFSKGDQ